MFDIFVEEIPHKATIYEHPRTMIYLAGPCDLEIVRDGNKIILRGAKTALQKKPKLKRSKKPRG